jgi:hypothetical protein
MGIRDFLIEQVHRINVDLGWPVIEDLRTWSNKDLLEEFGNLSIEVWRRKNLDDES